MSDVNEVLLSGRLTKKPELRTTPSGISVADLRVASNQYSKDKTTGETSKFTTFTKVTVWNKQAEALCKLLDTGSHVFVRGQLVEDNFETTNPEGTKVQHRQNKIDLAHVTVLNYRAKDEEPVSTETGS